MKALQFFLGLWRRFPRLVALTLVLELVGALVESLAVISLIPVVDLLVNQDLANASPISRAALTLMQRAGLPTSVWAMATVFLVLASVTAIIGIVAKAYVYRTKYALLGDMILGTFDDFFNARWQFFSGGAQGTLLNTFSREIGIVGDAFGAMAVFFVTSVRILLYLAAPFYISWEVTTISMGMAVILASPFLFFGRLSHRWGRINTATANRMMSVVQEGLALAKIIQGFGNPSKSRAQLEAAFHQHRTATINFQTFKYAVSAANKPAGFLMLIVSLYAAQRLGVPLSETAVLLLCLLQIVPLISLVVEQRTSLDNFFPSYEQIMTLRAKAQDLRQQEGGTPFTGFTRALQVRNLTFAYPAHEPALRDITLEIPRGTMLALVGQSGAGKSTFIDLIMGFHKPTAGQILFDDVPLETLDLISFRQRLGYVPQDSALFHMTLRENLLWAKGDATPAEIDRACRQANATEFIERLPQGLDTVVGDRGMRLSGGQVQRIALARAILRRPDLLILDEATSALDSQSERLIQEAIEMVARETTVIVIAHRLSTVVNADRIAVLDGGRLVEFGSYQELIQRRGRFEEMIRMQALQPAAEAVGAGEPAAP